MWWELAVRMGPCRILVRLSPADKLYRALRERVLLLSLYALRTLMTTTTNNINCSFEIGVLILYEGLLWGLHTVWKPVFLFVCIFCAVFLNNKSPWNKNKKPAMFVYCLFTETVAAVDLDVNKNSISLLSSGACSPGTRPPAAFWLWLILISQWIPPLTPGEVTF